MTRTKCFSNSNQIHTITYYHNDGFVLKCKTFNYNHFGNSSILFKIERFNKLGYYHCFNKPALINFTENGKPRSFYYYINGKSHNSVGPFKRNFNK